MVLLGVGKLQYKKLEDGGERPNRRQRGIVLKWLLNKQVFKLSTWFK